MRFSEYLKFVATTAVLPLDKNIATLGLIGESGEVAEHLKKLICYDGSVLSDARADAIAIELGDLFWYVNAIEHLYELGPMMTFVTMEEFSAEDDAPTPTRCVRWPSSRARSCVRSSTSRSAIEAACSTSSPRTLCADTSTPSLVASTGSRDSSGSTSPASSIATW